MNFFRKAKIWVFALLLPAMMFLAGNAVFNLHVHKNCDGQLIVHAHPFKTSNSEGGCSHSHSTHECISIQQITSFLFVLASVFILRISLGKIIEVSKVYHNTVKKNLLSTLLPNRAPPVLA
jgi:hypothetical protein